MKLSNLKNLKENFYFQYAALVGAVFLFWGKPVPYSNEYSYLLRLVKTYRPEFLLNDITFATPANEHWLFNHLFGLLTFFLSIEVIGWIGRISCWLVLVYALMRLGRHWKIPLWMISASIFLWFCLGQSVVADEWMIGNFEAKCVAYICLLFALDGFCNGRELYPAILLGLSFSFHPAVGLWGIPASILALAVFRWDFFRVLKITFISGLFSLFALIPLLFSEVSNSVNSFVDWEYFVLVGYPFHFDPASWAKSSIALLFFIMVFCLMFYYKNKQEKAQKFLITFLSVLCGFFIIGLILRFSGQYELLRFMPMRLFPVFAPLFFLFTLGKAFEEKLFAPPVTKTMIVGLICLLGWISPLSTGFYRIKQTVQMWTAEQDGAIDSFKWLKENTPNGTIVIAPPWRSDFWYHSERAAVVSYVYAPILNLGEWRTRLNYLVGERPLDKGVREDDEMEEFYNDLTKEKIAEIAQKYNAEYLVSEAEYKLPKVFESGDFKIYKISDKK